MNEHKVRSFLTLKSQPISVGILASDWLAFPQTLETLARHQLHLLHFDIADGQFSPLFTAGSIAVKSFRPPFIKDVHLMVKDQLNTAKNCLAAGADIITLQLENQTDLDDTYAWLHAQPTPPLCGISLCPQTPLDLLDPYLEQVTLIQLLTLDPRNGQKAEESEIIERIKQLLAKLGATRQHKLIAIDGAMNLQLAQKVSRLDIDWVVSGSALFASKNLAETLAEWQAVL